jgi:hypothetical protein
LVSGRSRVCPIYPPRRFCRNSGGFARSIAQCLGADVHSSLCRLDVCASSRESHPRRSVSIQDLHALFCEPRHASACHAGRTRRVDRAHLRDRPHTGSLYTPLSIARIGVFADVDALGRTFSYRLCMGAAGWGLRIRRVLGRDDCGVRGSGRRPEFGRLGSMAERAGPPPPTECHMEWPGSASRSLRLQWWSASISPTNFIRPPKIEFVIEWAGGNDWSRRCHKRLRNFWSACSNRSG